MKLGRRRVLAAVGAVGAGFGLGLLIDRPPPTAPVADTPRPTETQVVVLTASIAEPVATPTAWIPGSPPTATTSAPVRVEPTATTPARPALLPTRTAAPAATAATIAVPAEVSHVRTSRPVVALTFDAGGDAGSTASTLRALRDRGIRATFFVTGRFAELFPALVREMVLDGHELANHTYDHRDLQLLSNAQIVAELEKTDAILRGFSGSSTRPLMRPPFGSRDTRVRTAIASAGYRSIYWAIDGGDWKPNATPGGVIATVKRAVAGDVVVQHCSTPATASALPAILDDFAKRHLAVATVSSLLAG